MKNRSSTPVEVLNAFVCPITSVVTIGANGSTNDDEANGSVSGGMTGGTSRVTSSFHAKCSPTLRTWPASKKSTMRTWLMIEIRYSALNKRLLLPPRKTSERGTLGQMERISQTGTL